MKSSPFAAATLLLSACASLYGTPEQRHAANTAAASYMLCEKLATEGAPDAVRLEWAQELDKRGEDCTRYTPMLEARLRQMQFMGAAGLLMLQQAQPQPQPPPRSSFTCNRTGNFMRCN